MGLWGVGGGVGKDGFNSYTLMGISSLSCGHSLCSPEIGCPFTY